MLIYLIVLSKVKCSQRLAENINNISIRNPTLCKLGLDCPLLYSVLLQPVNSTKKFVLKWLYSIKCKYYLH